MKPLKVLIVDDERLARAELRTLLAPFPNVEICGEAANARQALRLVNECRPLLIFLDVEMPGQSGFDFLESLAPPHPEVIFTTAFDEFALRAFEVNALDYLVKPIHPKRLRAALEKVRDRAATAEDKAGTANRNPVAAGGMLGEGDRVFVREGDRCWFVPVCSIPLLEAEGNHTRIHFADAAPLLYRTLVSMEERLPANLFMRANRSQLINLTFIESIGQWFSGSLKVKLRGGFEVELSRRQAQLFRDRLSL